MPQFVVMLEDREVQRLDLDKDLIAIGRAKENDIVIENLATSRHHAQISCHGGLYYVTDLDSSNGTFVNEKRVSRTQIAPGDVIRVGKHAVVFESAQADAEPQDDFADFNQTMVLMPDTAPQHFLTVRAVRRRDQVVPLEEARLTVGRGIGCDVRVVDWFVDIEQAVVEVKGADCFIRHTGQTRPTLVNGQPVRETLLQAGDVIQMGMTQLAYSSDANVAQDPPGLVPVQQVTLASEGQDAEKGESTVDSGVSYAPVEEPLPDETPQEPVEAAPVSERQEEPFSSGVTEPAVQFSGKEDIVLEEPPLGTPDEAPLGPEAPEAPAAQPAEESPAMAEPEIAEPDFGLAEAAPEDFEEPQIAVPDDSEIVSIGVGEELNTEDFPIDWEEPPEGDEESAGEPEAEALQGEDSPWSEGDTQASLNEDTEAAFADTADLTEDVPKEAAPDVEEPPAAPDLPVEEGAEEPTEGEELEAVAAFDEVAETPAEEPATSGDEEIDEGELPPAAQEGFEEDEAQPVEADWPADEALGEEPHTAEDEATVRPAEGDLTPAQQKQVAMWEKALENPSTAVRKQAAQQLKRLTGREYDV